MIIDMEQGKALMGDSEEKAKEMLSLLVNDLKKKKINLIQAYKEKKSKQFREIVHKMHGGVAYCGVPLLKEKLQIFETELKTAKKIDDNHYQQLLEEIDKVIDCYQSKHW